MTHNAPRKDAWEFFSITCMHGDSIRKLTGTPIHESISHAKSQGSNQRGWVKIPSFTKGSFRHHFHKNQPILWKESGNPKKKAYRLFEISPWNIDIFQTLCMICGSDERFARFEDSFQITRDLMDLYEIAPSLNCLPWKRASPEMKLPKLKPSTHRTLTNNLVFGACVLNSSHACRLSK